MIIDMTPGLQSGSLSGDEQESGAGEDLHAGNGAVLSSEPVPISKLHIGPTHMDDVQSASTNSSQTPSSLPDTIPLLLTTASSSTPAPSISAPGPSTLLASTSSSPEHPILTPTSLGQRALSAPGTVNVRMPGTVDCVSSTQTPH